MQGYGQMSQNRTGDSDSAAGDSPSAAAPRTELSSDENGAIVAVLDYLIGNFQHVYSGDASPLYTTAAATHTLE